MSFPFRMDYDECIMMWGSWVSVCRQSKDDEPDSLLSTKQVGGQNGKRERLFTSSFYSSLV